MIPNKQPSGQFTKLFDLLGLLGPVIVKTKIIIKLPWISTLCGRN